MRERETGSEQREGRETGSGELQDVRKYKKRRQKGIKNYNKKNGIAENNK